MTIVDISSKNIRKDWWISKEWDISFYSTTAKGSISLCMPFKDNDSLWDNISISAHLGSFGYDGRYLYVDFTAGFEFRKGFKRDFFSISLDLRQVVVDIINLFK